MARDAATTDPPDHLAGRRLRIAQVAPLWTAVPPETYGGTELLVHWLTEGLVRAGHQVTLFAAADSATRARLHAVCSRNMLDLMRAGKAFEYEHYANAHFVEALRLSASFDVIHCHLGTAQMPVATLSRARTLFTLHTTLGPDDCWVLERYPTIPVVAISRYQAAGAGEGRAALRVIHHGIDFDSLEFSSIPGRYLAFLGRMGPQKSPLDAIRLAKAAGMPIVLAGTPLNRTEESYFRERIEPLIDGREVIWIGPVNHRQKSALLKDAGTLLFTIEGGEAFGIVMVEAMACGTPVLARDVASVGEIVEHGRTGFRADSVNGLAALVPQALSLDRAAVRERARRKFGHERMVEDYLRLYRELVTEDAAGAPSAAWEPSGP